MKKILSVLLFTLALILCACSESKQEEMNPTNATVGADATETVPETTEALLSDEEIYHKYLVALNKKLNNIYGDDTHLDGFGLKEGMSGINEIAVQSRMTLLTDVGYKTLDVNNDGTLELLICAVEERTETACFGTRILCAYTVFDNKEVLIIEGSSRQIYRLLEDHTVYYNGSDDTENRSFGTYRLDDAADALSCIDFYIDNGQEGLFVNHTGKWDINASESFEGDEAAFWHVNEELALGVQKIELTPFSEFEG